MAQNRRPILRKTRVSKKEIKSCFHSNVEVKKDLPTCSDCGAVVPMAELEVAKDPSLDLRQFMKPGKPLVKVVEYKATMIVKLPQLDEAFMPVFGVREGDIVVVYRPNP